MTLNRSVRSVENTKNTIVIDQHRIQNTVSINSVSFVIRIHDQATEAMDEQVMQKHQSDKEESQ